MRYSNPVSGYQGTAATGCRRRNSNPVFSNRRKRTASACFWSLVSSPKGIIQDSLVTGNIQQHLKLWDTLPRPPPKKTLPPAVEKPIWEDSLPWVADTIYSYDYVDPVYQE